jgi:DNA-binding NarL/FixJ family response regulator
MLAEAVMLAAQDEPDVTLSGAARSSAHARQSSSAERPDIIVGDLQTDGETAESLALLARQCGARLLLLVEDDEELASTALRAGAAGLLTKSRSTAELLNAVRAVGLGAMWVRDDLFRRLLDGDGQQHSTVSEDQARFDLLTPREQEVLALMVAGSTRREVAKQLYLSVNTVRTHTQNMLSKLGAHSTLEAVVLAMRLGVTPDGPELDPAPH